MVNHVTDRKQRHIFNYQSRLQNMNKKVEQSCYTKHVAELQNVD